MSTTRTTYARSRSITRRLEFDAGHRVYGHESKCAYLHGHRYVAELTVTADELDSLSRIVDFSVLKSQVGGWIDLHWDHNVLLNRQDPLLGLSHDDQLDIFGNKNPYIMAKGNPTAENMVDELASAARAILLPYSLEVTAVRLYETPNCWADWKKE